ncbi:MAG: DUF3253 domain-containing protein [Pseudomonadota bacterium]
MELNASAAGKSCPMSAPIQTPASAGAATTHSRTKMDRAVIADALMARVARLSPGTTFCPSEIARALATDWRPLMPLVRAVAADMPEIVATQKGAAVDPMTAKGPIRLGRA